LFAGLPPGWYPAPGGPRAARGRRATVVAELIRADGYEQVRVGGLDQSIRIEMFGDLHEYGALGRAVTKSEALAAV
jgi:predicted dinucleotide-binding enzyme